MKAKGPAVPGLSSYHLSLIQAAFATSVDRSKAPNIDVDFSVVSPTNLID